VLRLEKWARRCPVSGPGGVYTGSRSRRPAREEFPVDADLVTRARAGDSGAFAALAEPHRRELEVHCYRVLGSAQDAEDAVQETFLAAWQHISAFEVRASVRTWLFRIATNRCLDALRSARRRPAFEASVPQRRSLEPTSPSEVIWLEPYPDVLLDGLPDQTPGPAARYEAREAISLAFVAALQLLPPRQRVVLVLRDVLGYRAKEAAAMLETTEESVTSALRHARANVRRKLPTPAEPAPAPNSRAEQVVVERLINAYQTGDVNALVALLSDDVSITSPLAGGQYIGRAVARRLFETAIFPPGRTYRLIPTRANGQPAFGVYIRDPATGVFHVSGMLVITLAGDRVRALTRFDNTAIVRFGLPRRFRAGQAEPGEPAEASVPDALTP
jgi:RNA polymerase sigma-70 factor (TIGR02960 family)